MPGSFEPRDRPEVLAPAGSPESLTAALRSGADAVYFGLSDGFNARARAANFSLANLREVARRIRRAGARSYLTVNTLIFEEEITDVETILREAAASGVDALIIQDPAVALLARAVAPDLELHGSTQMTVSSPEGAAFAETLGLTRIVLPRELSTAEIREFRRRSAIEVEVFIHGALCVAWSGQCLTSEAWGGRSANRGQCAQSCRMPYDLVVDEKTVDTGDVKYLLSPKDLAGLRAVPDLVALGVHGLKIEGRQKGPHYVATAVDAYRRFVDACAEGRAEGDVAALADDVLRMALAYTRGFSDGFLSGSDHQTLVEGRFPKHRGILLGVVRKVEGSTVHITPSADGRPWTGGLGLEDRPGGPLGTVSSPLPAFGSPCDSAAGPKASEVTVRAGMGVVFDAGMPEDKNEPGGPIFRVDRTRTGYILGFGDPGPDLSRVFPGQRVWITRDPKALRETEKLLAATDPAGRYPLDLHVQGALGARLEVRARAFGHEARAQSVSNLEPARGSGITPSLLTEKLAAFGGTPFRLRHLDASNLEAGLHLPVSELKELRRWLVTELEERLDRGPERTIAPPHRAATLGAAARDVFRAHRSGDEPIVVPLVRSDDQLDAVIAAGATEVELDWMEMVGLGRAAERARSRGVRIVPATLRIQKPGEEAYDARLEALAPDGVLARHWGAVMHFAAGRKSKKPTVVHGDFSLNVTNSITAAHLLGLGLDTVTVSHDLDERQLLAMLDAAGDGGRFAVVIHHRIATFHTEHCVYSHLLSAGRDFRTCGRPCEERRVSVRDHLGREHPILVDAGCRNTVFNAEVQSAAKLVPALLGRGVRRFRVEFTREAGTEAARVLSAYRDLVFERTTPEAVLGRLGARSHFGVSETPMTLIGHRAGDSD